MRRYLRIAFASVFLAVVGLTTATAAVTRWGVDEHDFAVLSAGPLTIKARVAQQEAALERAAQSGDMDAAVLLGIARLYGFGVAKNEASAAQWIRRAADAGHPRGMASWSALLIDGMAGVKPDAAAGRTWAKRAADAGNAIGMMNLASAIDRGLGGPADDAESLRWSSRAADLGSALAMGFLGRLYEQGRSPVDARNTGIPRNEAEAVKWYQRGAAAGDELAKASLSLLDRRKAIPGKLTHELLAGPYNVAQRASYCEDALSALGGIWGARKPTADEQAALRDWKAMKSDSMKFSVLYGLVSLVGLHAQDASFRVDGKTYVSDATLSACETDRQFLLAHFPQALQSIYERHWRTANRTNRARRTIFQMAKRDDALVAGWCLAAIDDTQSSLGLIPEMYGYDPRNAAAAAQIERALSRLRDATEFWLMVEAVTPEGLQRMGVELGRGALASTRARLLERLAGPQWHDVILSNWLATEADLCVGLAKPEDKDVTLPLVVASTAASASDSASGSAPASNASHPAESPLAVASVASVCHGAELARSNGAATAATNAWDPIRTAALRAAVAHGESLRTLELRPAISLTPQQCATELQRLARTRSALERTWAAQQAAARKAALRPRLATDPRGVAYEEGWCSAALIHVSDMLRSTPGVLGLDDKTPTGRERIAQTTNVVNAWLVDWGGRRTSQGAATGVTDAQRLASLNAGLASFRRFLQMAKSDRISLPHFTDNELRGCDARQIN